MILYKFGKNIKEIIKYSNMQGIQPKLEIIPFDKQVCIKAQISIPLEQQKQYVSQSFFMCVIELRTALTENDVENIKNCILDTCEELLNRNGITNIGFVINEEYCTIRSPNYAGIKDLLNSKLKISQQIDFKNTLQCLRHTIMQQRQKFTGKKLTFLIFSSNVAENPLNPTKASYRAKINAHLPNYFQEIRRLKRTIRQICFQSHSYVLGFVQKSAVNIKENTGFYLEDGIDTGLLYQMQNCTSHQKSFDIVSSSRQLSSKLSYLSSLILYEFHEFAVMVPVTNFITELQNYFTDSKAWLTMSQNTEKMQAVKEQEDEDEEELQEELAYFLGEKGQKQKDDTIQQKQRYFSITAVNIDETKFVSSQFFFDRLEIDLNALHESGYHITDKTSRNQPQTFPIKKKKRILMCSQFEPEFTSREVDYHEPSLIDEVRLKAIYYSKELDVIIRKMVNDIVRYKKVYVGNRKYEYFKEINYQLQGKLRERVLCIEDIAKEIIQKIFKPELVKTQKEKRDMFELFSSLKIKLDATNESLMRLFKKQIEAEDIGDLSRALNYEKVRSSIRRKLIKRINSNPTLVDDVYKKVDQFCSQHIDNTNHLEAKYQKERQDLGNCMYSLNNFVSALKNRDTLGIVFEMQRPDTAIADPGRIRIRQISPLLSSVSKFFQIHLYGITESWSGVKNKISQKLKQEGWNEQIKKKVKSEKVGHKKWYLAQHFWQAWFYSGGRHTIYQVHEYTFKKNEDEKRNIRFVLTEQKQDENIVERIKEDDKVPLLKQQINEYIDYKNSLPEREQDNFTLFQIDKSAYTQNWDYWNRVESKETFYGILPLYICEQNWAVSKQLMKLCLGWNACGQPLGYTFSQFVTIPFMVQSSLIRAIQQTQYKISQSLNQPEDLSQQEIEAVLSKLNYLLRTKQRYQTLLIYVEKTCQVIMMQLSSQKQQQKLSSKVIEKYKNYKDPINRTIDVINNNSCFLGQIYTAIKGNFMQKPSEEQFHQFFKRLIEEQLRRETDGWNEQQVQDQFENRLLNAKIQKMDKPVYIVADSIYRDRIDEALRGNQILRTEFSIERQNLEMMLKDGNSFNDTQRLLLIEYKRLYQNRVLWFWFVRFLLYQELERIMIHKWKSLDLSNSYKLFTMIIQNKKQRKNWKRRQSILNHTYVDPFDYYAARSFLESEFTRIRNKKQAKNVVLLNRQKYGKAAACFARTRDLFEAAGALLNTGLDRQVVFFYQEILHSSNMIEEKLSMLLNGEYKGLQLMKRGWLMSKKRMNILRKKYPFQFQKYQYMF